MAWSSELRNVDLRYLVIAFVLLLVQVGLSSIKWQVILRSDGVLMRLPFLIKTYMIGNFISLFLPTSFGGDVYRVIAARGVNQDLAKSTSSVLFDRLSGLFALISICMIAYVVLPEQPYGVVVLVLYVLGVVGFFVVSSNAVGRLIEASKIRLGQESRQNSALVSQLPSQSARDAADSAAFIPVPAQHRGDQQGLHAQPWGSMSTLAFCWSSSP